jgi:hypothetical protein
MESHDMERRKAFMKACELEDRIATLKINKQTKILEWRRMEEEVHWGSFIKELSPLQVFEGFR